MVGISRYSMVRELTSQIDFSSQNAVAPGSGGTKKKTKEVKQEENGVR